MIPAERLPVFEALAAMCRRYPDWRLGQIVCNVAGWAEADVWDVEDDQLLAAVEGHLQRRAAREAGEASLSGDDKAAG
jgi:hypothetical protein